MTQNTRSEQEPLGYKKDLKKVEGIRRHIVNTYACACTCDKQTCDFTISSVPTHSTLYCRMYCCTFLAMESPACKLCMLPEWPQNFAGYCEGTGSDNCMHHFIVCNGACYFMGIGCLVLGESGRNLRCDIGGLNFPLGVTNILLEDSSSEATAGKITVC